MANQYTDKMKHRHRIFCQLFATGRYTQKDAYLEAGYSKGDAKAGASRLMAKPKIQAKVRELQRKHEANCTTDAKWIREQLELVVAKSGKGEEIMVKVGDEYIGSGEFKYDAPGVNKALDTLNRMNGGYEKDNTQKSGNIKVKMEF